LSWTFSSKKRHRLPVTLFTFLFDQGKFLLLSVLAAWILPLASWGVFPVVKLKKGSQKKTCILRGNSGKIFELEILKGIGRVGEF